MSTLNPSEDMMFVGFLGEPMPKECYQDKELLDAWMDGRSQGIEQGLITVH